MLPRRFVLQVKILTLKGQWPRWQAGPCEGNSISDPPSGPRGQYLGKGGYSKLEWNGIMESAAQEHSRSGKPLPEHKVQAEYGNGKFSLDGQWAKYTILPEGERCTECKNRDTVCRIVERDAFYTRGLCTWCLAHKSVCSLHSTAKETEIKTKRGRYRRKEATTEI